MNVLEAALFANLRNRPNTRKAEDQMPAEATRPVRLAAGTLAAILSIAAVVTLLDMASARPENNLARAEVGEMIDG